MTRLFRSTFTPLAIISLAVSITAQSTPIFSGEWIESARVDGHDVVQGTLQVTQDSLGLTSRHYDSRGTLAETWKYLFDKTFTQELSEVPIQSTVRWRGRSLHIANVASARGRQTLVDQTWSLDASGALVIETTSRGTGREPTTTRIVYRRK